MVRPELKEVHCPFVRTMLSAQDAPPWNREAQEMEVGDLTGFVRAQPGDGDLDNLLRFFSIINHGVGNKLVRSMNLLQPRSRFSTKLMGSDGDHGGGSHIYHPVSGEFDERQFATFTAFSSNGKVMTIGDLGNAVAGANQRHGGTAYDALQSAVEFGLLATLIGDRRGAIRISDIRLLFEQNEFPAGARENLGGRTTRHWLNVTVRIADAVVAAAEKAGDREKAAEIKRLKQGLKKFLAPLLATAAL